MASLEHIGDHFAVTAEPRVLEQYKDSERWKSCLEAVIDQMQVVEDAGIELSRVLEFREVPPTGAQLDWIASFVNFKRYNGESDTDFYNRFVSSLGRHNAGTPDSSIEAAVHLSGDPKPRYFDEAPATFFIYTPNGRQLKRKEVRKTAMAGVLGLPGAAIRLGNGGLLRCANGKLLLSVARDYKRIIKCMLTTDDGKVITTEDGKIIYAEIV